MFYLDIVLLLFSLIYFPVVAHKTGNNMAYGFMAVILIGTISRIVSYLRKLRINKSP